ncbi:MAG: L,D-transpeptidase family protein [Proteobacteria bacterium]|nr:L,D-transpeptidase family protein [Pseudomonadota bacterium]
MSDLVVTADRPGATQGWAEIAGRKFRCALGRGGILPVKREGDGGTPVGSFPLRRLYMRADKGNAPKAPVPISVITKDDGWCDAPEHADYNRRVTLPFAASHETMWRDDHLYDLVLVIGHNDDPVVPFMGSAVFVHLARPDYGPTEGCIAFARADLEAILASLGPQDRVVVERP